MASDERLVAMVRTGSQPAFELLYDRHHRGILSFCRHMLSSQEEAEDAVQHTFMAAYRDLVGSEKEIQLRPWLYAIARNRCLSVLRSRREQPSDDIDEISTVGLADEVQRRQDLRDLLADLAELPDDQRAALVLAELGALPHEEIADVVGCRPEKVRALVFQARSSLIASRQARDTSCEQIREELATLRGGSLRRTHLRRHLKHCAGCREFRAEVDRQRRAMAVVLPVLPALGLKESALAAAFGGGMAAKGAAGGAVAAGVGSSAAATAGTGAAASGLPLVAKVLVVAAVAGGGTAGGVAGVNALSGDGKPAAPASSPAPGSGGGNGGAGATAPAATADPAATATPSGRRRGQTERGKEWAKTRGKGKKRGLNGTQPGKADDALEEGAKGGRANGREGKGQTKTTAKAKSRKAKGKLNKRKPATRKKNPVKPVKTPRPQPTATPRPERTPVAPKPPKPEPTPPPAPTVEPVPTVEPDTGGGSGGGGGGASARDR